MSGDAAPTPRVRIVHCIGSLAVGGAERQLAELICRLPPDRFEQSLVLLKAEGAFLEQVRHANCDVVALRGRRPTRRGKLRTAYKLWIAIARIVRHLIRARPHIVHGQMRTANILVLVAGRVAGVRAIATSQLNLCRDPMARTRLQRIENRAHRAASGVFANSNAVVRDLVRHQGVDPARIRLIYNGVDVDRFAPRSREQQRAIRRAAGFGESERVLLCVANLHPYKGHADLIRAFALLDPAHGDLTLVLVGRDEGEEAPARVLARELGVERRIRFTGQVSAVEEFLAIAELVVHPSHEEGFANAILEAMSAGRPVIACDVGGNAEAIVDGETGVLVPPSQPGRLAAAMNELLGEPGRACAMGRAGRQRIEERFAIERMVDDFAEWYDDVVAQAGPPRRVGLPGRR